MEEYTNRFFVYCSRYEVGGVREVTTPPVLRQLVLVCAAVDGSRNCVGNCPERKGNYREQDDGGARYKKEFSILLRITTKDCADVHTNNGCGTTTIPPQERALNLIG